jgi:hypothetical protein
VGFFSTSSDNVPEAKLGTKSIREMEQWSDGINI